MSDQPEVTFRSYSQQQGAAYSQHRRRYSPKLYDAITKFHESGSGQFGTLLDVGCGPGIATFTLAPKFKSAIGIDQSEGMISTARSLVGSSPESGGVRFEVSSAEALGSDLADPIQEGSVDVITAATCAHWFGMAGFWSQAAKVLKPGGTVALWTGGSIQVDESMPNHTAIQAIIDGLDDTLADYMLPGNLLTRDLYQRLPLPWTLESPVADFDQASFTRKEWRTGPGSETGFFAETDQPFNFDIMELALGTASPVTRWREAHPEAVGTEDDVIRIVRRKIEKIFEEAGVKKGEELLKGDVNGVLLLVRKKMD
ncbi:trans-aconitate 3-methyltransferase [Fusarium albosuccineum]|uniref:Trans-aconitate 3-methyltransferase n=1 Tax=Fusarium albosuccineum TaxID=1237068 RepID=A0A8H4P4Y5_9HYPO|nr:trans-aconitate 3-methyltransferase [Fusarium albosuccineum]